jgi:hypothetical protein
MIEHIGSGNGTPAGEDHVAYGNLISYSRNAGFMEREHIDLLLPKRFAIKINGLPAHDFFGRRMGIIGWICQIVFSFEQGMKESLVRIDFPQERIVCTRFIQKNQYAWIVGNSAKRWLDQMPVTF